MSSSLKKITSSIYGSGNSLAGSIFPQRETGAMDNLLNYYKSLDTSKADETLSNLENEALGLSGNLTDYISSVDGSDTARQQVVDATYQSYLDLLEPQHAQQTDDLSTRLLNQGLTVGSQAWERAMSDLQQEQNQALNQAAYQSVLAGNDAYNASFDNAYKNATLNNQVRSLELDEIYQLLKETMTEQELKEKMYSLASGIEKTNYQNASDNFGNLTSTLLNGYLALKP